MAVRVVPQSAHDRTKAELKRDAFTYDEQRDVYLCPNGKELRRKRLYRSGSGLFWEYWAEKKDCGCCPLRQIWCEGTFAAQILSADPIYPSIPTPAGNLMEG